MATVGTFEFYLWIDHNCGGDGSDIISSKLTMIIYDPTTPCSLAGGMVFYSGGGPNYVQTYDVKDIGDNTHVTYSFEPFVFIPPTCTQTKVTISSVNNGLDPISSFSS